MHAAIEAESTLTDRYQTTVPETVRRALNLGKRDKIHYAILADGTVILKRLSQEITDDPAIEAFLNFLAQDIVNHPERLKAVDTALVKRIRTLVDGVTVDLDAALSGDDE